MIDIAAALSICTENFPNGPESLAATLGVTVAEKPLTGCEGWCVAHNGVARVTLNANAPLVRRRFTLAHELAHLLLGTRTDISSTKTSNDADDERSADHLAAEMLLPLREVRRSISTLPVHPKSIARLAQRAQVSVVVAARRIASSAIHGNLVNGAVLSFRNQTHQWTWSNSIQIQPAEAVAILHATEQIQIARLPWGDGTTLTASRLDTPEFQTIFVQILPTELASAHSPQEQLERLGHWLFDGSPSLRGQLNGCLGSFKEIAQHQSSLSAALEEFNQRYVGRWTDPFLSRFKDPRGQQYIRLRLAEWIAPDL